MYKSVDPKVQFPKMEESVLKFWNDNDIFQKSIDQRQSSKEYRIYDGPPFATGLPHFGHLVPGTIKDIFPRYKTMQGYKVPRTFGWDCHGLPVENDANKRLGISGHNAIEEYGVAKYNEYCRSIVLTYTEEWKQIISRIGRWVDFEHGYKTMDTSYMESIWWIFKTLYDKGLIYEGYNVLAYSPGLGSPLSNMEVNLGGYQDVVDQAITVKFKRDDDDSYFLAWTTTPWTLPSNLALALGKDIDYVKILDKASGEKYILGKARLHAYYKDESEYEILESCKGTDLAGKTYEPLFPYFKDLKAKGAFITVLGDYVTTEDGCGIVHTAPGFGEDDYQVLKDTGIPVVCPIDQDCNFTSEVSDYQGIFVKDADKQIISDLKAMGKLVKRENYLHSYPFCWRTHKPIIYRAMSCWYVNVTRIKEQLCANNEEVFWMPDHIKHGRFGKWLEGARDWAISRNRYWGNPLPIWKSESGKYIEVIGSKAELEAKCGKPVADLHKHFIDDLTWTAPDGSLMKRIPDVLDCWFESGSMPYAQEHYPFENKEHFESNFPADFICEGLDQTRGWFYTLMIQSTALFNKPAFYHCVTNGIILAEDGRKMSKSERNYTDPMEIVNTYGADALRFALMNSPAVRAENLKFSDSLVKEVLKSLLLPLWNAYSFFVTYANLDGYNTCKLDYSTITNPMDQWIISAAETLISDMTKALDGYDIQDACSKLLGFIDSLNNWYIRRCRRRFWKSESDSDKKGAYDTLGYVLLTFCKLACPIIPFVTEEIYQNLKTDDMPQSIHLCSYPQNTEEYKKPALEDQMNLAMRTVSLGRALRASTGLKIRQPLSTVFIVDRSEDERRILESMTDIIVEELNVKSVKIDEDENGLVSFSAKANFKVLGKKLGKSMKAAAQKIEALSSKVLSDMLNGKTFRMDYEDGSIDLTADDLVIARTEKENVKVLNEGTITLGFDTELTDSLVWEGVARDLVRIIQSSRKDMGLEVSDRIELVINGPEIVEKTLEAFKAYIMGETLAVKLDYDQTLDGPIIEAGDLDVIISIKKA